MAEKIVVYRFEDAPAYMRAYSTNGGDEDWLAVLPARYKDDVPMWLDSQWFGCCCRDEYVLPDGRVIVIGAHA